MAIYHCSVKNISRSSGKSAVASASYRAGEKLEDMETGLTHDYTRKKEVAFSEIILCENAPSEYQDRETLWNAVEKIETQSNARLAREWEVAIPNELTLEQGKELVRGYAQSLADEGMCVDANIHWKDGNHHAHIMGTTRPIKKNGEWGQKEKKAYKLDENGQKIPQIDPKTGEQKIGARGRKMWQRETVESNDWNRTEKVEEWRKRWADHCNMALEKALSLERVDHRSFERQGIERIPTIHEGYIARDMEQKGQTAERCEINRDINVANIQLSALEYQQSLFTRLLEQLKEKMRMAQEALRAKREEALDEQLQRLRTARTTDESAKGNADGNSPVQTDHSQSAEGRIAERLSALRGDKSSRGIGESDTEALIREARAIIDNSRAREENSRADRANREAERSRQRAEAQRRAEEAKREAEARQAQRRARSRSYGIDR